MFGYQRILGRSHGPARLGVLCLVACGGLWGCGQKGPLYLPSPSSVTAPPAATPAPSPAQNVPAPRLPDTPER
ncbi:lipoprotein [Hydrogenophaga sp. IBVHS2]|uniref:LptM family lipoprotein n=1 Tax=Hydrogenophaga sp. IBVHS2 TaxID=1985170 RepID=UPI00117BA403|nr:lipoprotein [Hydrogenophaga sp. IBVHS2]